MGSVEYMRLIRQRGNPTGPADTTDVAVANAEESESAMSDQDMEIDPGTSFTNSWTTRCTTNSFRDGGSFKRWTWNLFGKRILLGCKCSPEPYPGVLTDGERWNHWSFGCAMQSKDPRGFHRAEHQCTKSQSTQCAEPIPKNRRHVPNLKQWKYFFFSGSVLSATMADNLLERDRKVEKWSNAHYSKEECVRFAFPCTRMTLAQIEMNVQHFSHAHMNSMWIYPRPSWLEKGVQPASHFQVSRAKPVSAFALVQGIGLFFVLFLVVAVLKPT